MKLIKKLFAWSTATRLRKILSVTLAVLILLTSIRYIFLKPKTVLADSTFLLNEGYGTTTAVNDNNGNVTAGTITGAVWKTDDLCYDLKCLYFDGTQDYVSFTDDADLDFTNSESFTIAGWFRHAPKTTGTDIIIGKMNSSDNDGGFQIQMESDGDITCEVDDDDADTTIDDTASSTAATYDDNQWHNFACVKSGSTSITLYIDAIQVTQNTSLTASTTLANDDPFSVGIDGDLAANDYTGFIDEIKVYRSARSSTEVKADYNGLTPSRGTSVAFGPDQSYLSNGLLGYWNMELTSSGGSNGGPTKIDDAGNPGTLSDVGSSQLVRTSTGTLYTVIYDDPDCEIWKSTDGTTWTEQDTADNPTCAASPSIAVDSNNDIHILYQTPFAALDIYYLKFTTSNDQFGTPESLHTLFNFPATGLSIAIDSNNVPHVVYALFDDGSPESNIWYRNKVGGSWNTEVVIESAGTAAYEPADITISEDNIPEIAYIYSVPPHDLVAALGDANNATSFTLQVVDSDVSSSSQLGTGGYSSIAVDSSGNTWIGYLDNLATDYISLIKHNDADGWSTWQSPINNTNQGTMPSIAIDGTDVYILYEDESNDIVYDKYTGSWIGQATLQTGTFETTKARWAYNNNASYTTYGLDYMYSDTTDIYWASIGFGGTTNLADKSTNSLTLTNNGVATFVSSKFGVGSEHVPASSQYLSTATTINGVKSISFWTNPDATTNYYISLTSSDYITSTSGTLATTGFGTNEKIYVNGVESSIIVADQWQFVTVTTDSAINADTFYIGRQSGSSNYYDGTIDDVRLYNVSFSPSLVSKLYSWAPVPVGHWKLDENTLTTAQDSSGNDNAGTLTNSPSWTTGKFGAGVNFAGSNQHITRADDTDFDFGTAASFSYGAWIKHSTTPATVERIITKYDNSAGNGGFALQIETDGDITCGIDDDETSFPEASATSTAATYDDSLWHHIMCVKDEASTLNLYIDGVLIASTSISGVTGDFSNADPLYIGIAEDGTSNDWIGQLDNIQIYNYARTSSQVIEDMNGGHPSPGSPVGSTTSFWSFDEGYSTTAYDKSSNANNLTTAVFTNNGKFGKAFDGADNRRLTGTNDTDFEPSNLEGFSISIWVKSDGTTTAANEYVASKVAAASAGYDIYFNTSEQIVCEIDDDTSTYPEDSATTTANYYDQSWHHVVCVRDISADKLNLFVDGKLVAQDTDLSATGAIDNSAVFYLGDTNGTDGTDEFLGDIDETKFYRLALSSDQVKVEYNRGSGQLIGSLSTNSGSVASWTDTDSYCPPRNSEACVGPVAEWKLDENTGTTTYDSSENENVSTTWTGATWHPGKFGSAISFNGNNQVIQFLETTSTDIGQDANSFTIQGWFKTSTNYADFAAIATKYTSLVGMPFAILVNASEFGCFMMADLSSNNPQACGSTTLNDDNWHFITGIKNNPADTIEVYIDGKFVASTTDTTVGDLRNNEDVSIGNGGSSYTQYDFNGQIDNIKIYDYIRTPAQIAWDYNRGGPVGWWKMDENTGTTANDSSGFSNSATLSSSSWSTGKFNTSWNGDGALWLARADDPDFDFNDSEPFALSMWVKSDSAGNPSATEVLMNKHVPTNNDGYRISFNTSGQIVCEIDDDTTSFPEDTANSTTDYYDQQWHHIVCNRDITGDDLDLYVDGRFVDDDGNLDATTDMSNADNLSIGDEDESNDGDEFFGDIDDVRIFRYALSNSQVQTLYSENSATRFGPASGSP